MKKCAFIIHGWDGYPEEGWFPWLKQELERRGFDVFVPAMPETAEPKMEMWVPFLSQLVGEPDKNTYFIGHSIGCQAILRYLETVENKKVGGAVLVAPWFALANLSGDEEVIAKPWIETPVDFKKIKQVTNNFVAIFSDNDHYVLYGDNYKIFEEKLGAEIILEHNKCHFSGGDGIVELPVVLEQLGLMISK